MLVSLPHVLHAAGGSAPRYGKPLDTVVVTADRAPVLVADKTVATAQKGQWFGVRDRKDGRVAVQMVVGTHIRTGWLREEDVRLVSDEEVDLATEALKLAKLARPSLDVAAYRQRIAALADRARAAVQKARTPTQRARAISSLLFRRERFTYQRDNRTLDQVLDTRRGNCLSLSLLYLCVSRKLDLPIHLVAVPRHAFLRYDDGTTRFSIEPSMGGILFSGERPAFRRRPLGGIHLKLLSRPQTVGLLLSDLGAELGRRGQYADACKRFARAIEISPEIAEAYCDWGIALARLKQWAPACDKFSRSIQAHPRYAEAYCGWGSVLAQLGEDAWACEKYARATAIDPRYAEAYYNWGAVLLTMGRAVDGAEKLERAARLDPRLRAAVERLRAAAGAPRLRP